MHEVSVATGVVKLVLDVLKEHGREVVRSVHLVIGKLTCVDDAALRFALKSAMKDTAMEGAEIIMEHPEPAAACRHCGREFPTAGFVAVCPNCNSVETDLVHGRELYVRSIEAE